MRTTTAEAKMRIRDKAKSNFCFNKDNAHGPSAEASAAQLPKKRSNHNTQLANQMECMMPRYECSTRKDTDAIDAPASIFYLEFSTSPSCS